MRHSSHGSKYGLSTILVVIIVVVIIIIAGALGAYYLYYAPGQKSSQLQSFTFALSDFNDPSHAVAIDALNHVSQYNLKANDLTIADPTALTSATSNGQVDLFAFQLPTTTINAIETGANVVAIGEESTTFLQDLVVSSNITTFSQLNGTTMAAFQLDGPVLFPLVWAANGLNYSNYNINLVVLGDSSVKAQGLIAGKYAGAFLDPVDAATVFQSVPGKFHVLASTAQAFGATGASIIFANKAWLNTHFQIAVDFDEAIIQSARQETSNLQSWINSTYSANFTSYKYQVYNSTEFLYHQADFFSPNMITYTPSLMNASDSFMFFGGLINATGNVNQIYNFSVAQAALKALGTVQEPAGPFQNFTPLSISNLLVKSTLEVFVNQLMALPLSVYQRPL